MSMQTSYGLDGILSTTHINRCSVKGGRYETETYLTHTQMLYSRLPFHSLQDSGVRKSYISIFFQSSYPTTHIPVTFHVEQTCVSSSLTLFWCAGQWSDDRLVSTHCMEEHNGVALTELRETVPAPPTNSPLFDTLSISMSLSPPWGLVNAWPCLTWTTLMSSPPHYCTYSTSVPHGPLPLSSIQMHTCTHKHTQNSSTRNCHPVVTGRGQERSATKSEEV